MKGLLQVLTVALAAVSASCGQSNPLPRILGLSVEDSSLVEHHTDHFEIEGGFAVRRGQAFDLLVRTDAAVDTRTMKVFMENDNVKSYNNPDFDTEIVKKVDEVTLLVRVKTDVTSALGKYEDITLTVDYELPGNTTNSSEVFVYEYPFPIYLLFNPWLPEDKEVYIPTEEMRQEHIINNYGNVFCGSTNSYDTIKWYYGQSNQITLDAAFHLLEKADRQRAGEPIHVVQTMSQNQGMMRKKDGSVLVGTEESLLEGNWGDFPFDDTNSPELWTSTTDILNRWKETGKPTKYGQCWVFGALQNALMRAIGVGSRQLTAFGAWMDMSSMRDKHHKLHHVADEYYDINGTSIYMESQAWNYHSWNDIWLQRSNDTYSGWQSLDGTPPGKIGPAPLKSIHDLDETYPFNSSDVISTVHSTSRTFLVACNKDHKRADKLKGCHVDKLLQYDHSGLKLILSSKTLENSTLAEKNITGEFIDPNTDAFIPFTDDSSGRRLRALPSDGTDLPCNMKLGDAPTEEDITIIPDNYGIIVGSPITGMVEINSKRFQEGEFLQLNLMFTLETRTGKEIKTLLSSSSRVLIEGSKVQVPFFVDSSAYLQKDLGDVFVKIIATGISEGGKHVFDKDVLDIDAPPVIVTAPDTVDTAPKSSPSSFPISASFRNPLTFDLKEVCITLHSHQLSFKGLAENVTSTTSCQKLRAGGKIKIDADLIAPEKAGTYYVLASLKGDYLPFAQAHSVVVVTEASTATATTLETDEENTPEEFAELVIPVSLQ